MNEPVSRQLNVAVLQIASRLFPTGYDVAEEAPGTLKALQDHVRNTGRMLVWSGASDATIFGDREVNWAFRAWHDHCHLRGNHPFNPVGELATLGEQLSDLRKLYGTGATYRTMAHLLVAEVAGQIEYQERHAGEFPRDQRAFALAYVANPAAAIAETF